MKQREVIVLINPFLIFCVLMNAYISGLKISDVISIALHYINKFYFYKYNKMVIKFLILSPIIIKFKKEK